MNCHKLCSFFLKFVKALRDPVSDHYFTLTHLPLKPNRITAMVLLALALEQWVIIVLFVHWLAMTLWVVYQNTDFCTEWWEERLYNAIVGVIYCFCFFNLKEGRYRTCCMIDFKSDLDWIRIKFAKF